jgi:vancomycin aglycone glucosyltransferase
MPPDGGPIPGAGGRTAVRVALVGDGTVGDIAPLLELGRRLRLAGHDVLACAPPDFAGAAAALALPFRAFGRPVRAYLEGKASALAGSPLGLLAEAQRYSLSAIETQLAVLPAAVERADLVVGGGIAFGAASLAELCGARYRYLIYCPALLPSREHAPLFAPWQGLPGWVNRWLWRLTRLAYRFAFGPALDRGRAKLGLRPLDDVERHLISERPILAADRALAPAPSDAPIALRQIPALQAMNGEALPAKLEQFLAAGPPPVFFGFGSMTDAAPRATSALVVEVAEALGRRAILSAGWAGLGDVPLPESVCAIGPVPHAALFPRVAAVVHHGGAGTTTTAARAGAPQVLVPHVLDQFYWARRVEALGIGVGHVARRRLSFAGLRDAVAAVLEADSVAERARELGARLRRDAEVSPDPVSALLGP